MDDLEKSMKVASSSIFSLALATWFVHFNVIGTHFWEYHKFLNKFYDDSLESFDGMSEEIRALDLFAPASLSSFATLSVVEDMNTVKPALEMLHELLVDTEKVIQTLEEVNRLATEHIGLQNFVQDRVDKYNKWAWMLRSFIQTL
ncbi:Ferritin-like domain protein [uncultured archaeon]|nr:Ferritin-like domain protein [uncultured archaeon]